MNRSGLAEDGAAYGCIVIQGHGKIGSFICEAAGILRYGQLSADEYFLSEPAAKPVCSSVLTASTSRW